MCSDGWEAGEIVSLCPECGNPVDEDGDTVEHCNYSPVLCKECEYAPCDGSC